MPVRGGSQGLPGKNLRELAGRPLFRRAVDQGLAVGADLVVLSTDIEELHGTDLGASVIVHERPTELAGDDVPMDPVLADALDRDEIGDADVVLLQATSPLRRDHDILACLDVFRSGSFDLAMSVYRSDSSILKCGTSDGATFRPLRSADDTFANRQSLPAVFRPNGAVYAFGANWFRDRGALATDSIGMHEMDVESSTDIDSLADFERCETILAERQRRNECA